jgi:hypothetical protein
MRLEMPPATAHALATALITGCDRVWEPAFRVPHVPLEQEPDVSADDE